jgi:small-conductance mechanosensitive channel
MDTDPALVERVLLEVAEKAAQEVPEMLREFPPSVFFVPGFGASSLDFTLFCPIKDALSQQGVQHELRKRIYERFVLEGIEIPFPTRTVYVQNPLSGTSGKKLRKTYKRSRTQ